MCCDNGNLKTMRLGGEIYFIDFVNTKHQNWELTNRLEYFVRDSSFSDLNLSNTTAKSYFLWYRKLTDMDVVLNHHSIGPNISKSGIVTGLVHQMFNQSSGLGQFPDGISRT